MTRLLRPEHQNDLLDEIRGLASPLRDSRDLDHLLDGVGAHRR